MEQRNAGVALLLEGVGRRSRRRALAITAAAALVGGCASLGPPTIPRDRLDYDHAVGESWKRQLLLNVVKLRYGDAPIFLDVASITNSYGLETQASAGLAWSDVVGMGYNNAQNLSAAARYTDKPTITYTPLVGNRFTKSLMTPISPAVVISLLQAGWAADAVMSLTVSSVNGVQNRFAAGGRARAADADFYRLIGAMRRIQATGAVGMKMNRLEEQGPEVAMMTLSQEKLSDATEQDRQVIRDILGMSPDTNEYRIVFGSVHQKGEIAMITRSMLEMLIDLAGAAVEVPPEHVAQGRALPTRAFDTDPEGGYIPLARIHCGKSEPKQPFAAIQYRDQWFWIDDGDYRSKTSVSFMLILFSLLDSDSSRGGAPVITIPAG